MGKKKSKPALSEKGEKVYQDHIRRDFLQWKKDGPLKKYERKETELIYAPVTSFLQHDESGWIYFVNKRGFWTRKDYTEAIDHIVSVLHRYIDAQRKKGKQRDRALSEIAAEITTKLNEGDRPSFMLRWMLKDDLPADTFIFGGPGIGIFDAYFSLVRFLSNPSVAGRLKKCKFCRGLFIAPDRHKYEYCPGTDHQEQMKSSKSNPRTKENQRKNMRKYREAGKPYAR